MPTEKKHPDPTEKKTADPVVEALTTKKRRTQDEIHRERLAERITKLESDRDAAVRAAIEEINENAENDRKERIAKASARVMSRYAERIDVQRRMLSALEKAGHAEAKGGE